MKAGVGLVLEEAAAEAQDADKLWPIADGGLGGGKMGEELKAGVFIATLPYLLALLLFYSLAIHMHQSLEGWPERIGTDGFPPALLMHDQIQGAYISYLLLFTIFVVPAIILVCLLVSRWRHLVVYFVLHVMSLPVCYVLMQLAPEGYLYWWWD